MIIQERDNGSLDWEGVIQIYLEDECLWFDEELESHKKSVNDDF